MLTAACSDPLSSQVQRLQALVTQQRAALAALERRATDEAASGGAVDGQSPLAASIAHNRQLLKQVRSVGVPFPCHMPDSLPMVRLFPTLYANCPTVSQYHLPGSWRYAVQSLTKLRCCNMSFAALQVEARLEEWASSLPAVVRQRLGLQAGNGASPTVQGTASAMPALPASHSNAASRGAPASAVGSLEAETGLQTGDSLRSAPQTPLANGNAYGGRAFQGVVVNDSATVPEGGASAHAERSLTEAGGHRREDSGATHELPSLQHGQQSADGATASVTSSSSSSPHEETDIPNSKLSWVEQAKTRVLQRLGPVPKDEPASKSRSNRTQQPATALPSSDETVVQEPSVRSNGATEDRNMDGVVPPPAAQPRAPTEAAPAPNMRQLSSKFFSKAPPVRPFSVRKSQDMQDG